MNFSKAILVFLSLSIETVGLGQAISIPVLDKHAEGFVRGVRLSDEEKIFLQTDKWFYAAGEDL
jgi:hypothetical protein